MLEEKQKLSEVHSPQEVCESGIRSKALESGIDVEKDHPVGAILKSLL
jgi:hypothetical protein